MTEPHPATASLTAHGSSTCVTVDVDGINCPATLLVGDELELVLENGITLYVHLEPADRAALRATRYAQDRLPRWLRWLNARVSR